MERTIDLVFTRAVRRAVLGVLLMLGAPAAWSDELSLLINGHAHHISPPANTNYNERNWGAGLQYDYDRADNWVPFLTLSEFRDSMRHPSYYAGGGLQYRFEVAAALDHLHADFGAVAFVMQRRNFNDGNPFLGALPALTLGTSHVSLNITYIPKVHPKLIPLWFFQLKIPLAQY